MTLRKIDISAVIADAEKLLQNDQQITPVYLQPKLIRVDSSADQTVKLVQLLLL
ncbi:hypothetical protein ACL7TT_02155 [Microbulbifer sp. 2304DJ12-6]|uniref:hypothetical protein n=1 Tax=Microbulbifer sp. 2304DJ12-6 TaxID=3233340 RepID=UPI0039B08A95